MGILTPASDSFCYRAWDWDNRMQPHELRVGKKHGTTHWLPDWDLAFLLPSRESLIKHRASEPPLHNLPGKQQRHAAAFNHVREESRP